VTSTEIIVGYRQIFPADSVVDDADKHGGGFFMNVSIWKENTEDSQICFAFDRACVAENFPFVRFPDTISATGTASMTIFPSSNDDVGDYIFYLQYRELWT
jgi:hypothetical protein